MPSQDTDNQSFQADDYIKLGHLLKRKRDERGNEQVEFILNSSLSVDEKIRKIESLDQERQQKSLPQAADKPLDREKIRELFNRHQVVTQKTAQKSIEKLKKKIFRLPYLWFVFSEFRKIKQFARETRTLIARYVPPRIRVDSDLKTRLMPQVQKDAADLFGLLEKLLATAWQILEKPAYNLLIQFQNLCLVLSNTRFHNLDFHSVHLLDSLLSIERLFLICYRESEYPGLILSTLTVLLEKSGIESEKSERYQAAARRILLPEEQQPSLYYLLLAANITKYRRYLTLQEILNRNTEPVINNFQFECSEKTRIQIEQFLKDKQELLERFAREKYEIDKLHYFLLKFTREEPESGYDFRILSAFYNALADRDKYIFTRDYTRLQDFLPRIAEGFLDHFEDFLTGTIQFQNSGRIRVFSTDYNSYEAARLHSFLEKFYKELFNCAELSLSRFLSLKKNSRGMGVGQAELNLVQIVEEIGEIFAEMGRKLSEILVRYQQPEQKAENSNFTPLEPSLAMLNHSLIPFWDEEIRSETFLGNKTFRTALEYGVNLCFQIALLLENQKLEALISRRMHVNQEYEELRKILQRVTDVLTFEKIESSLSRFPL